MDLFEVSIGSSRDEVTGPLADRVRPNDLGSFEGQKDFADEKSSLIQGLEEKGFLPNLILWGPPGTGKTTFAHILAKKASFRFIDRNAISTGAKDLRSLGVESRDKRLQFREKTILFIDEIHRLNKAQQDVLLPFIEKGDLTLVGATTENPAYSLNAALLSRSRVLVFKPLETESLMRVARRAMVEGGYGPVTEAELFEPGVLESLCRGASGDARSLLTHLETLLQAYQTSDKGHAGAKGFPLDQASMEKILLGATGPYDRTGDYHYDTISAFIKSLRGSDPDAGLYYLARMLDAGEDPVFIARRLVILASEDVGNADPRGLQVAVAGLQAVELVGLPEAAINLAQVVTYLACAPKSNRSYEGLNRAMAAVKKWGVQEVPKPLRSAQTKLAKSLGHGEGYEYSHDQPRGKSHHEFLPEKLKGQKFYEPSDRGFEKVIREYQAWVRGE